MALRFFSKSFAYMAAFGACLLCNISLLPGQNDWTVISTAGSPDPVTTFDLSDPGGSQTLIGNVDGNFNRGMDYFGFDSFYYFVSTDTLNDPGDRGLWSWVGGANTQLATIGFSDTGDGDASYDFATSQLFVTVDDGDATDGDSLYVWDDLGGTPTFTEVGETGLTQLIGLAVDPNSGTLYGIDGGTDSLYTIDRNDGSATLVGSSGSVGTIGGMDFNLDGSTLLLSDGNDLFTVSTLDGSLTAAGSLGTLNTSALAHNVVIPEPSSLVILAIGSSMVLRRRRS